MARRSTKARVEGAKAQPAKIEPTPDEAEIGVIEEGASGIVVPVGGTDYRFPITPADPVPGDNGDALDRISAYFQEKHPEDWENIRLTPLQHGLIHMAELLRARG